RKNLDQFQRAINPGARAQLVTHISDYVFQLVGPPLPDAQLSAQFGGGFRSFVISFMKQESIPLIELCRQLVECFTREAKIVGLDQMTEIVGLRVRHLFTVRLSQKLKQFGASAQRR